MCGICGVYGDEDKDTVHAMMESMRHRGPDDKGDYFDSGIGLGHLRLSIIDLSARGRQPMHNENETVWVTYNGEIYNFHTLREELEGLGHSFYTDTDTEVLVHGWEQWGKDVVGRLRGMFAMAIYDAEKKSLFLAVDRFGKKPIYHMMHEDRLYFASELKALLKVPGFVPKLRIESMDDYLSLQYVPGPDTILAGVKKMLPAHWMLVELNGISEGEYWDFPIEPDADIGFEQAAVRVRELLEESVRLRLMADVPLGAFLSGGLDSSALVALMSEMSEDPVKTFSIGYGVEGVDETGYARMVADHLGTDHTQIHATSEDVVSEFEKIVWHLSEPIGDPALLGAYFLSKETVKRVKVAFGGGGADEVFGGYRAYKYGLMAQSLRETIPKALRMPLAPLTGLPIVPHRVAKYLGYVSKKEGRQFYEGQGILFSDAEKGWLVNGEFRKRTQGNDTKRYARAAFERKPAKGRGFLNRLMYTDIKGWLTWLSMYQYDGMSMAHSLEARAPYLDHKLIEYCNRLPGDFKMRGWNEKYILKRAVADMLPETIIKRRKTGFTIPTNKWLFEGLWNMTEESLKSKESLSKRYFKSWGIDSLLRKRGDFRVSTKLFGLLMLEKWTQKYLGDAI